MMDDIVCRGCGSIGSLAEIRAKAKAITGRDIIACCPERQEITVRDLIAAKEALAINDDMVDRFKAAFRKGRGLVMPSVEFIERCLRATLTEGGDNGQAH